MAKDKLAEYVVDECFKWFKLERENLLEENWRLAYDAFKGAYSSENLSRWRKLEGFEWRSKVFVRLTKHKVVSAVSQIEDIVFQGGQLPWGISPTPYPETAPGIRLDKKEAEDRCTRMKVRIDDILNEARAERVIKGSVLEKSVYGLAWLKSPVIRPFRYLGPELVLPQDDAGLVANYPPELISRYGRHELRVKTKMAPVMENPSVWEIFWDMENPDPQDGQGIIHRVMMSPGQLRQLLRRPGYNREAINAILANLKSREGQTRTVSDRAEGPYREGLMNLWRNIPVYEFYGRAEKKLLKGRGKPDLQAGSDEVEIITVVAGAEPLVIWGPEPNFYPGQVRPLHLDRWEDFPHEPGGEGIPASIKDSQMMVNSAVRCFIDNKALSSNVLIAGRSGALAPGQSKQLYPGKFFELAEHIQRAQDAIQFFSPQDVTGGLLDLVNLFERFADEESNLPRLLQGEVARFSPKTAFESSQLLTAANKAMGKIIRNMDENHIEPVISGLYYWIMATDPDETIKGDYTVSATGFSSYTNRTIRGRELTSFLGFALSNELLARLPKISKLFREIARVRDIDPDEFIKTDAELEEEAAALVAQMQAPPGPGGLPAGAGGPPMLPPGGPGGPARPGGMV